MNFLTRYKKVRLYTVHLCKPLKTEDYALQVAVFTSPPKWHLAHTTWFFEEFLLKPFLEGYRAFDEQFNFLFNSYYQQLGSRICRKDRGIISRPSVEEVYTYREYVDKHVERLLTQGQDKKITYIVELGLQHEQQHQELLLTDIKYAFCHNPTMPVYKQGGTLVGQNNQRTGILSIDEGLYEIGHSGDGFSYDNEKGRHQVYLHAFSICEKLVTNGDVIEFIEDGGYKQPLIWLDDGWSWVGKHQITMPPYWQRKEDQWLHYTLGGLLPVERDHIASHLSFYEATAIARWLGMRLPTEYEWEVASDQLNWGKRWEWTNSAYLPYPFFEPSKGIAGEYNGKFMINTMVLRGASTATSPGHSRKTYRNFFNPHSRWQYSGVRLASWKHK